MAISATVVPGKTWSSSDKLDVTNLNAAATPTVNIEGAVGGLSLSADSISNSHVNSAAAIAHSKLAALTGGNVLVGSSGNVATSVAVSGDATMSNTGAVALTATSNATLTTLSGLTTIGANNITMDGNLYQGDQGYSADMKIHQCGQDTFAYDSSSASSKTYTGTQSLPHQRFTPVEFWIAHYLNQAYHLTYRWHVMNHSAGITVMYESGGDVTGGAGNMGGIFGSGYSLSVGSSGALDARKLTVTVTPGGGNNVSNIAYATLAYGAVLF